MTRDTFLKLDPNTVHIVDIREPMELAIIPSPQGAQNIPLNDLVQQIHAGTFPKDKPLVTVCASGGRCHMIHALLLDHGYEADYLEGGVGALR